MNKKKNRDYDMTTRAEAAAQTERNIMKVTTDLWRERSLHDITLEAIAERARVSVRTILRKYGSKESLYEACVEHDTADIMSARNSVPIGDVETALRVLMEDYEKNGDANVRTLALEEELPVVHKILESGRKHHREWCARVFAPYLPAPSDPAYESCVYAFYAATEIYLWKLLRRDLHRDFDDTLHIFRMLVYGLINNYQS